MYDSWSSVREPTQVFTLLESLYQAFDSLAKKRFVFKIETIGDCYVAVAGLPEAREDHALMMALFARDCLKTFQALVGALKHKLGPGTSELGESDPRDGSGIYRATSCLRPKLFFGERVANGASYRTCNRWRPSGREGQVPIVRGYGQHCSGRYQSSELSFVCIWINLIYS